ncbi:hypothetical protein [Streptomyces jumonjinensis]|nr:hypothetical protein [Streptomyces jumonjinensis]
MSDGLERLDVPSESWSAAAQVLAELKAATPQQPDSEVDVAPASGGGS